MEFPSSQTSFTNSSSADLDIDDLVNLIGDPVNHSADWIEKPLLSVEQCKAFKTYQNRRIQSKEAYWAKKKGESVGKKVRTLLPDREGAREKSRERYRKGGAEFKEKQRQYRKTHRLKLRALYKECKSYIEDHGVPPALRTANN